MDLGRDMEDTLKIIEVLPEHTPFMAELNGGRHKYWICRFAEGCSCSA